MYKFLFQNILLDPKIVKVGVGVHRDAYLLLHQHKMQVKHAIDLRYLAQELGLAPESLEKMALRVAGIKLVKDWKITESNWEAPQLSQEQIDYAAADAHASVEIYKHMLRRNPNVLHNCVKFYDIDFLP